MKDLFLAHGQVLCLTSAVKNGLNVETGTGRTARLEIQCSHFGLPPAREEGNTSRARTTAKNGCLFNLTFIWNPTDSCFQASFFSLSVEVSSLLVVHILLIFDVQSKSTGEARSLHAIAWSQLLAFWLASRCSCPQTTAAPGSKTRRASPWSLTSAGRTGQPCAPEADAQQSVSSARCTINLESAFARAASQPGLPPSRDVRCKFVWAGTAGKEP